MQYGQNAAFINEADNAARNFLWEQADYLLIVSDLRTLIIRSESSRCVILFDRKKAETTERFILFWLNVGVTTQTVANDLTSQE